MGINTSKDDEHYNVPYTVPWFQGLNTQNLNLGRQNSSIKTNRFAPDSGDNQTLKDVSEHSTSITAWQIRTLMENFGINITYAYATMEVFGFMILPKILNSDALTWVDLLGLIINLSVFGNKLGYQYGNPKLYLLSYILLSVLSYAIYLAPPDTIEHVFDG
jgi:hypothetical protein